MVFSPARRDLDEITITLKDYLRLNLKKYLPIEIQEFSTLAESSSRGESIGTGGEILIIFDRRICPSEERKISFKEGFEKQALIQNALKMSKEYCDKVEIPYVQYEGEITNRIEKMFITKIDGVKDKIIKRLEEGLY